MLQTLVSAGRRGEKDCGQIIFSGFVEVVLRFLDGEIGDEGAVDAGGAGHAAELGQAHAENWVEIGKDDETSGLGVLADFGGEFEDVLEIGAVLEGALAGPLDDGSVGQGIAEGDAEFDDAGSGIDRGENNFFGCSEIGVAASDIGDEGGFAVEVKGHEGSIVDGRGKIAEVEAIRGRERMGLDKACYGLARVPDAA